MMIKIHWCDFVRVWISIYFYEPLIISFMTLWKVEIMKKKPKKSNQKIYYYVGFKDLLPIENVESLLFIQLTTLHGD